MSKGTPSLHSLVHRGRSLLKTILFCLRVMTISEYFPNKSQMNDETPQICKNDSFRGALSPRGKPFCLRVLLLLTFFILMFVKLRSRSRSGEGQVRVRKVKETKVLDLSYTLFLVFTTHPSTGTLFWL